MRDLSVLVSDALLQLLLTGHELGLHAVQQPAHLRDAVVALAQLALQVRQLSVVHRTPQLNVVHRTPQPLQTLLLLHDEAGVLPLLLLVLLLEAIQRALQRPQLLRIRRLK